MKHTLKIGFNIDTDKRRSSPVQFLLMASFSRQNHSLLNKRKLVFIPILSTNTAS